MLRDFIIGYNVSHFMRKPVLCENSNQSVQVQKVLRVLSSYRYEPHHEKSCFAICEQQMRRSACASVQSDQHLCYLLLR